MAGAVRLRARDSGGELMCDCRIINAERPDREIIWCPMHQAARELLESLEVLVGDSRGPTVLTIKDMEGALDVAEAALAAANGE